MNDLHQLHSKSDEAYAWWLLNALPAMRGKLGYISQAIQSDAGISFVRADTAEIIDTRRDSSSCEGTQGEGVKA